MYELFISYGCAMALMSIVCGAILDDPCDTNLHYSSIIHGIGILCLIAQVLIPALYTLRSKYILVFILTSNAIYMIWAIIYVTMRVCSDAIHTNAIVLYALGLCNMLVWITFIVTQCCYYAYNEDPDDMVRVL